MARRPLLVVIVCLLGAAGVGWLWTGAVFYRFPIDLDSSAYLFGESIQAAHDALGLGFPRPFAGPFWIGFSLLLIAGAVFWIVRRSVRVEVEATDPGRRRVLTGAVAGGVAALGALLLAGGTAFARAFYGLGQGGRGWRGPLQEIFSADVATTHPEYPEHWKGARVQAYRRFGRTGYRISDVVLGSGRIKGEKGSRIVREALERGVNYVDTSPDYSAAGSENAVGEAIRGRRDQVFLATKFCTPHGHLGPEAPVSDYKRVLEASLRRLGTDYVDLVHIHSCDEVERLRSETMHEAFERLKEEGKVRFLGFSSHTPRLVEVAEAAIASGRFDVMMLAYHHGIWPRLAEVIAKARREQDMGVIAMKTLKGARHRGMEDRSQAEAYSQAALKWVLSNPDVSAAVISFFEHQHVDEYLQASGATLASSDLAALEAYDRATAGTYCAPHCGACHASCPEGLPIADVLRHRMYFEDYGDEKEAMRLYAGLEKNASVCAGCAAPCLGACPLGVSIRDRMVGAHELLTLS
ncbi:MAG: aldo/keto reductase [Myxococcota bacterium]|nr:aldo/keto reductase [Myxococcota bacterium]